MTVFAAAIDPDLVALVERAKTGDGEAFAGLYDRYVDQVYGFVYNRVRDRDLAEDLTSDVFLRALRSLERFTWQGVDIGAWLVTIARNRVTDHFKSARARLERPTDEMAEPTQDVHRDDDPERAALNRDEVAALATAIGSLAEDHRDVLELRFIRGLTVSETAAAMNRTDGAIKALQYRALKALANIVRESPHFDGEVVR